MSSKSIFMETSEILSLSIRLLFVCYWVVILGMVLENGHFSTCLSGDYQGLPLWLFLLLASVFTIWADVCGDTMVETRNRTRYVHSLRKGSILAVLGCVFFIGSLILMGVSLERTNMYGWILWAILMVTVCIYQTLNVIKLQTTKFEEPVGRGYIM